MGEGLCSICMQMSVSQMSDRRLPGSSGTGGRGENDGICALRQLPATGSLSVYPPPPPALLLSSHVLTSRKTCIWGCGKLGWEHTLYMCGDQTVFSWRHFANKGPNFRIQYWIRMGQCLKFGYIYFRIGLAATLPECVCALFEHSTSSSASFLSDNITNGLFDFRK
jgi:hypothetical protein